MRLRLWVCAPVAPLLLAGCLEGTANITYVYNRTENGTENGGGGSSGSSSSGVCPTDSCVTQGLVARYDFSEGGGGMVSDCVSNHHAWVSGIGAWTGGKKGAALRFDGSSTFLTVPHAVEFNLSSGVTLEAWVERTAAGGGIVGKSSYNGGAFMLWMYGDRPDMVVAGHGTAPAQIPLNSWQHLVGTYDRVTKMVYVNGALGAAAEDAFSSPIPVNTDPVLIGKMSNDSPAYFSGIIDQVKIYDRALSAAEVIQNMNCSN